MSWNRQKAQTQYHAVIDREIGRMSEAEDLRREIEFGITEFRRASFIAAEPAISYLARPVGWVPSSQRGYETVEARFGARGVGPHGEDERLIGEKTVFIYALGDH